MYPILARPHARGSLRLRSNNPQVLWFTLEALPCTPSWPGLTPGVASSSAPTILRYFLLLLTGTLPLYFIIYFCIQYLCVNLGHRSPRVMFWGTCIGRSVWLLGHIFGRYFSVLKRGHCHVSHPGQASRQGQPQAPLQQSSGTVVYSRGFAMYPVLARPHARGSLRLRSNNPKVL